PDVGQQVLADRGLELRLVDLHQRGAELGEKPGRLDWIVAEAAVPQLPRERILAEAVQQPGEVIARPGLVLEARGELRQQGAQLAGGGDWLDRRTELLHVLALEIRRIVCRCPHRSL